ncbi:MAG: ABC transporter ATP-binding protein/permease [Anaerolineae bacterium]|nr:ABC transporter ATP-binding protein/permease [Anaerolineae bacterium]
MEAREFTLENEYQYVRSGPVRWIISHILRYPLYPLIMALMAILANVLESWSRVLVGQAFDVILSPQPEVARVLQMALSILAAHGGGGLLQLLRNFSVEVLAQRFERDSRDELYVSLLGKSLSFHDRQRIGDIMARATNDVRQLNFMVSPGLSLILNSAIHIVVPIAAIGTLDPALLVVPVIFVVALGASLHRYSQRLNPVSSAAREQFGTMNAGLTEAISGIEVVKATAQEQQEQRKFSADARRFRDLFVQRGEIQARYIPLLLFSLAFGAGFLHALLLYTQGRLSLGDIVAFMGLMGVLRFPTFISIFSFSLVALGRAAARRILELVTAVTELDENEAGIQKRMRGEIVFENVSFGYRDGLAIRDISFTARPGETIAIVGQTGSGKSTLTKLVDRIYDATSGRVLVDGVDVRDWNLTSLRSQISTIEQDVFLFSRSLGANIAFGVWPEVKREDIERYAREAQAHDFIMGFTAGYATDVGERGVTLSGGERQRIAIARAFMTDPRILILDDATSAIDSATEDKIQRAMRNVMRGRTTLLITHRLSQIRWADRILVLQQGTMVDQGTHEELLARCEAYRRIFARYEGLSPSQLGENT